MFRSLFLYGRQPLVPSSHGLTEAHATYPTCSPQVRKLVAQHLPKRQLFCTLPGGLASVIISGMPKKAWMLHKDTRRKAHSLFPIESHVHHRKSPYGNAILNMSCSLCGLTGLLHMHLVSNIKTRLTIGVRNKGGFTRQASMDTTDLQTPLLQTPFTQLRTNYSGARRSQVRWHPSAGHVSSPPFRGAVQPLGSYLTCFKVVRDFKL